MKLHISLGNMKLGNIPNISLPPPETCKNRICFKDCYAMKSYRQYPNVREAWDANIGLWREDHVEFGAQLSDWLRRKKPAYFRFHVGGDIPTVAYYSMMVWIAKEHPNTKFMAFTKHTGGVIRAQHRPDNLQVIYSRWPGDKEPKIKPARQAWLLDSENLDSRIPVGVFECPGSCVSCKHCFDEGSDVVFKKH